MQSYQAPRNSVSPVPPCGYELSLKAEKALGQKTAPCPHPRAPPHQKIPPSFHRRSGRPTAPAHPDRDYADYSWSCHTRRPPATSSPLSETAAPPAGNSTANENDNATPAAAAQPFHPHSQCHTQTFSRANAYAEKSLAASHRSAACP